MRWFAICAYFASLNVGFGQQAPEKPRFEVASIKSSDPNPENPIFIGMSADEAMERWSAGEVFEHHPARLHTG